MRVAAVVHELDGRVNGVRELQVEDALARPDAGVEILVPELESQPDDLRVEADRRVEVRRSELGDRAGDRHHAGQKIVRVMPPSTAMVVPVT